MPTRSSPLAIASLLFAATLWGVFWYPLRLLESAGLAGLWATLVIYAAAMLVLAPFCLPRLAHLPWRPHALDVSLLAVAAGICNVAFILAVLDGEVMRVLLLFYLSPLWTVLFGWWLIGERPMPSEWGVIGAAMAGALLMLWEPALGYPWPRERADWLALASGAGFALANVEIRRLQAIPVLHKTFVSWIGVVAVAMLGMLLTDGWHWPQARIGAWLGAAGLGAFGMVLMTLAVQYGVTHMPVHRSAVILLFELVAGALSSWWLAGEHLRPLEWAGGGLIVAGALLSARAQMARG